MTGLLIGFVLHLAVPAGYVIAGCLAGWYGAFGGTGLGLFCGLFPVEWEIPRLAVLARNDSESTVEGVDWVCFAYFGSAGRSVPGRSRLRTYAFWGARFWTAIVVPSGSAVARSVISQIGDCALCGRDKNSNAKL